MIHHMECIALVIMHIETQNKSSTMFNNTINFLNNEDFKIIRKRRENLIRPVQVSFFSAFFFLTNYFLGSCVCSRA